MREIAELSVRAFDGFINRLWKDSVNSVGTALGRVNFGNKVEGSVALTNVLGIGATNAR